MNFVLVSVFKNLIYFLVIGLGSGVVVKVFGIWGILVVMVLYWFFL